MVHSRRFPRSVAALLTLAAIAGAGCAELGLDVDQLLAASGGARPGVLDERTIAAGLKEALQVGSRNASAQTSAQDGYWKNSLIRIPLPREIEDVGSTLRRVGFARQVDEFELAMNRAAERAAAEAVPVFASAITQMTVRDAVGILRGPDDAATQYLRRTSGGTLEQRFQPIIGAKMREVGVVRLYEQIERQLAVLPLVGVPKLDLERYVTGKAVDGLFVVVAEEEQKIRSDPAARVTELLRRVFRNP